MISNPFNNVIIYQLAVNLLKTNSFIYKQLFLILFCLIILMQGCKSRKSRPTYSYKSAPYSEDIGQFRPSFQTTELSNSKSNNTNPEFKPSNHINEKVQIMLDSMAAFNRNIQFAQGFRIIIYTGNDRETAINVKERVYKQYPDQKIYMSYKQPTFKVKVGDYLSQFDAQKMYAQLKDGFPNVLIVQDQINLRRQ